MIKYTTVKQISVRNWDDLVQKTYSRPYSFQQQDGCKDRGVDYVDIPDEPDDYENDSIPEIVNGEEMGVSFKAWLERDSAQPLKDQEYDWELGMWWDRNFYPHISMIANDLHEKGLIEAGKYQIVIDW